MDEPIIIIKQLLVRLLSEKSPELGARLKQRLTSAFASSGLGYFDEKSYGFRKFSDFLTQAHGDIVKIERQDTIGDVLVSLQQPVVTQVKPATSTSQLPRIRNDIWQAFSNPDPERKRFLHKTTLLLRHYTLRKVSDDRTEVEQHPDQYIEIQPISAQKQHEWMKDFLETIRLSPNEKNALEAIIKEPYSSGVNATFSRALGEHGTAWRHFRTRRIVALIKTWSDEHKIAFNLFSLPGFQNESPATRIEADQLQLSSRQQAYKLLDLLTDDDISRLVIPTLLSTILIKSRI